MKKVLIILACFIAVLFSGCGKSAIKCDNGEAQKLVMEITEQETKNQLVHRQNPYASLEKWRQLAKEGNADIQNALARVDKQYQEAEPKLLNIRPESMDNELEKSECSADLSFSNGNKIPVKYKLSKTSEGKLYAEVFGLK